MIVPARPNNDLIELGPAHRSVPRHGPCIHVEAAKGRNQQAIIVGEVGISGVGNESNLSHALEYPLVSQLCAPVSMGLHRHWMAGAAAADPSISSGPDAAKALA